MIFILVVSDDYDLWVIAVVEDVVVVWKCKYRCKVQGDLVFFFFSLFRSGEEQDVRVWVREGRPGSALFVLILAKEFIFFSGHFFLTC